MDPKFKKVLGKGLASFSADSYTKTDRAGFTVEASDVRNKDGIYHDEWAAHQNGGGQELVETYGGKKWTRVYAGGSPSSKQLAKIGISETVVSDKIKYFLGKVSQDSRFDEDIKVADGDWEYVYTVMENIKDVPVVVGKEEIKYNKNTVFVHFIINSPVI